MITTEGKSQWGVSGRNISSPAGVLLDFQESSDVSYYTETDRKGSVTGHFAYDVKKAVSLTVNVSSSAEVPSAGEQIQVDGVAYYVTSAQVIESNRAYKKVSVSAEKYSNCDSIDMGEEETETE